MIRSGKNQLAVAIVFFVIAAAFSVIFWADVSLSVKIGMFALGFGSGVVFGTWFAMRNG